jgi:aminoglycoside phosphotransferase family enzyme/predicted kinase
MSMQVWQQFEALCQAMTDPAFYPHPVPRLERRDTHISTVFLTGQWAYKLKKPVDFGFLNFVELSDRLHFCQQEVLLNQRFSQGIYQGVVRICRDPAGKFVLDGCGEPLEYAVKMAQLSEESCLKERLRRGTVSRADLEALGRYLAGFYQHTRRSPEIDHFGDPQVIGFNVEENFRQVESFTAGLLDPKRWALLREVSRSFLKRWHHLFIRRIEAGRVRDGHGDLRSDHIYFHDGIQIIDCIEFNERFRYGDVAADLAFLYMDMDHRGHAVSGRILLAAYVAAAEDPEVYILLDFYAAYRAMVMVKVHCLRFAEAPSEPALQAALQRQARRYLEQAYRYAVQFSRPTLWIFCGLPATGKSTLAREVAEALELPLFRSDAVRKERLGLAAQQEMVAPFGKGIYRPEISALVYGQLLALAQEQLKSGHSVVLDATYARRRWRQEARQLAEDVDVNLLYVECYCSEATMHQRLAQRQVAPSVSDARPEHLSDFLDRFEALAEVSEDSLVRVDTDKPVSAAFAEVLSAAYARKCAQVLKIL